LLATSSVNPLVAHRSNFVCASLLAQNLPISLPARHALIDLHAELLMVIDMHAMPCVMDAAAQVVNTTDSERLFRMRSERAGTF
jgi:hypothetical protein